MNELSCRVKLSTPEQVAATIFTIFVGQVVTFEGQKCHLPRNTENEVNSLLLRTLPSFQTIL